MRDEILQNLLDEEWQHGPYVTRLPERYQNYSLVKKYKTSDGVFDFGQMFNRKSKFVYITSYLWIKAKKTFVLVVPTPRYPFTVIVCLKNSFRKTYSEIIADCMKVPFRDGLEIRVVPLELTTK